MTRRTVPGRDDEPTIEELLRSLPERVDPDPAFSDALRSRLAHELRGVRSDDPTQPQEITLVDIPNRFDDAVSRVRHRLGPRLLVAAAVALLALVGGGVLLLTDDDADPDTGVVTSQPDDPFDSDRDPVTTDVEPAPEASETTTVVLDPDPAAEPRSFVGGGFDTFPLADQVDPYRVVATADAVWTMSLEGLIVRRDPATLAPTGQLQVAPGSMLAADADAVWVGDTVAGTVLRIDPATAEVVATVETGIATGGSGFRAGRPGQPAGDGESNAFSRLGDLDVSDGSVWVSDLDGRLLQIDASTDEVVAALPVDVDAHVVRSAGRFVLLGDQQGQELVAVIDVTTGETVASAELDWLVGADLTEDAAYAYDQSGVVIRLDLATGAVTETESFGDLVRTNLEIPYFAHRPAVTSTELLLTTRTELLVVDLATLAVVRREPVDGDRGMLTVGPDGTAWIVEHTADVVHRLTPAG